MTVQATAPFADTVARVREALKEQGFDVLTEIDVRATMREKLGEDMEDYLIPGGTRPRTQTLRCRPHDVWSASCPTRG